jgi:DNA-binding PadR family transcriptional regulator
MCSSALILSNSEVYPRAMDPGLTVKALIVLSLLDGPGYGQLLADRVRGRTRGRMRLRAGSLYPTLQVLARQGLLRSWIVRAPGARGRPRRYYELTPSGLAAAGEQRELLAGFLGERPASPPSSAERQRMRDRMRRCSELSRFLQDLREKAMRSGAAK